MTRAGAREAPAARDRPPALSAYGIVVDRGGLTAWTGVIRRDCGGVLPAQTAAPGRGSRPGVQTSVERGEQNSCSPRSRPDPRIALMARLRLAGLGVTP